MFCPDCANRRSIPLQKDVLSKVNRPGKQYFMLTLTVPNVPELTRDFLKQFVKQFSELRELDVWNKIPRANGEEVGITGGVYSVECTYNEKRQDWHPHIHALIEGPCDLSLNWIFLIREAWSQLHPGAEYVHLVPIYEVVGGRKRKVRKLNMRHIRELCKYVTKCASFATAPALVDEFLTAFKSLRRIQSFGSFYGVEAKPENEPEPGDERGAFDCECGDRHRWSELVTEPDLVHLSETVLMRDGTRQLKFDYVRELREPPAESPPILVLEPDSVELSSQCRIPFWGAWAPEPDPTQPMFSTAR